MRSTPAAAFVATLVCTSGFARTGVLGADGESVPCALYPGLDVHEHFDLFSLEVDSVDACKEACLGEDSCNAAYHVAEKKRCMLKAIPSDPFEVNFKAKPFEHGTFIRCQEGAVTYDDLCQRSGDMTYVACAAPANGITFAAAADSCTARGMSLADPRDGAQNAKLAGFLLEKFACRDGGGRAIWTGSRVAAWPPGSTFPLSGTSVWAGNAPNNATGGDSAVAMLTSCREPLGWDDVDPSTPLGGYACEGSASSPLALARSAATSQRLENAREQLRQCAPFPCGDASAADASQSFNKPTSLPLPNLPGGLSGGTALDEALIAMLDSIKSRDACPDFVNGSQILGDAAQVVLRSNASLSDGASISEAAAHACTLMPVAPERAYLVAVTAEPVVNSSTAALAVCAALRPCEDDFEFSIGVTQCEQKTTIVVDENGDTSFEQADCSSSLRMAPMVLPGVTVYRDVDSVGYSSKGTLPVQSRGKLWQLTPKGVGRFEAVTLSAHLVLKGNLGLSIDLRQLGVIDDNVTVAVSGPSTYAVQYDTSADGNNMVERALAFDRETLMEGSVAVTISAFDQFEVAFGAETNATLFYKSPSAADPLGYRLQLKSEQLFDPNEVFETLRGLVDLGKVLKGILSATQLDFAFRRVQFQVAIDARRFGVSLLGNGIFDFNIFIPSELKDALRLPVVRIDGGFYLIAALNALPRLYIQVGDKMHHIEVAACDDDADCRSSYKCLASAVCVPTFVPDLDTVVQAASTFVSDVGSLFADLADDSTDTAQSTFQNAVEAVTDFGQDVLDLAGGAQNASAWLDQAAQGAEATFVDAMTGLVEEMTATVAELEDAAEALAAEAQEAAQAAREAADDVARDAARVAEESLNTAEEVVEDVGEVLQDVYGTVTDWFSG